MNNDITIRSFSEMDAAAVRALFINVNRLLAPAHLQDAFETYIASALAEEIDRIIPYYEARQGGFWVAVSQAEVIGMFGLETVHPGVLELRRMYVAPLARRQGIARSLLHYAEMECRRRHGRKLELSTSELQPAALALYRRAGYHLVREVIADQASNKTLGGGIRRYHFEKCFLQDATNEITAATATRLAGPLSEVDAYQPWLLL